MRYVTFSDATGKRDVPGVIEGESDSPVRLRRFFTRCVHRDEPRRSKVGASASPGRRRYRSPGLKLLAPLHPKKNVFCVGRNYLAHAEEGAKALGTKR